MVAETTAAFLAATGLAPEGFAFRIDGEVPPARGLGSSVTVIAGVLAGLNVLRGTGLSRERLVALATELEGHPDNASAGILGGFCVSRCDPATGAYLDTIRVVIPSDLIFVVVSPESEMLTKAARGVLPASLPYFDAVRSINSASYLVAAFATGQFDRLRHAVADFMHEPYRLPAIPGARAAIDAGCAAGALTGWLSGSGSSVLCVCRRVDVASVSAAMSAAFTQAGLPSVARALTADNEGLRIE
jgi:homoserine kinase